jgi:integrase
MASCTKRNGRWRARVRRADLPSLTKSFLTKTLALQWSQRVEINPEEFLSEQVSEDHQLKTLGDLLRKYGEKVISRKKGTDKEKYRIKILEKSSLSGVSLKALKSHHVTQFRQVRLEQVSAGTVLKDLGLLSAVINTGRTEWGLENVIKTNPVSLISKPKAPKPRDRRLEEGELERLLHYNFCPNPWFRPLVLFAIETGMRRGEMLSLTWEHLHLEKRYVHLPDTKNGDSRNVPLSPVALELLRDLPRNIRVDQLLFPSTMRR